MSAVKIDNRSGDTITACVNGREYTVQNNERITVDSMEKGSFELRIHRTRVPMETENFHDADRTDFKTRTEKADRSMHTQLDGIFNIKINAAKSVITVKPKIKGKERLGVDAVFSGYSVEVSGAVVENEKQCFANKNIQKKFIKRMLTDALLPVGVIGIFLLILGLIALRANIIGKSVNIGGRDFTYPWSIGLIVVSLGFLGYTAFTIINILSTAKKLKT